MDRTGRKSSTTCQVLPASALFQGPLPELPARLNDGFVGLIAIARTRPPMLFGPSNRHEDSDEPLCDRAPVAHRRLLEPIGYVPPAEYEARDYEQAAVA